MPPHVPERAGRVRTTVGLGLAAASLGLVVWFTCRPAGADHPHSDPQGERAIQAAAPRTSVVVSVLRSEPRLADPGTPITEAEWTAHHQTAIVQVDGELGKTLIARAIPPPPELQLDSAPIATNAPIGSVAHLDDGSLRVIDGWTNGTQDLQIELRLWPSANVAPRVEAGAWDVRGNEAPSAWSELHCEVATSTSTWNDGDHVVLRYRVTGTDADKKPREEGGLVRVTVP